MIIEKGAQLALDPEFEMIVGDVEGLGFALFKQKCQMVAIQYHCNYCGRDFTSYCASKACGLPKHDCGRRGVCQRCGNDNGYYNY